MIVDIDKKTIGQPINRYYILTTFANTFATSEAEIEVITEITKVQQSHNMEIIANGILSTIKYYLRFVDNYHDFITAYTQQLNAEAQKASEVKTEHLTNWAFILKKYQPTVK